MSARDRARQTALDTREYLLTLTSKPCYETGEWLEAETRKNLLRSHRLELDFRRDNKRKWKGVPKNDLVPWTRLLARKAEFYAEYEEINRLLLPSDPVYSGNRGGVALSTTTDFWTLTSGASGQDRILEMLWGGEATTSAVNRISVQRATSGTTATNQTPELFSTRSPAAVSTFATTWSAQPTLSGNPLLQFGLNAFGGGFQWVAVPGEEPYLVNGEKMSCRSASGTSTFSGHVIWEEL